MTETGTRTIVIRNEPNHFLTRYPCELCGGSTEKQEYLFKITDEIGIDATPPANPVAALFGRSGDLGPSLIVCDGCAEDAGQIPARLRARAERLRQAAAACEAAAVFGYVTEVVPDPDGQDEFPDWMRERLGLPPSPPWTENECGERVRAEPSGGGRKEDHQ